MSTRVAAALDAGTHHNLDEFKIFGVSNFAHIVKKYWKLSEVDCVRQLGEDPLDAHLEQLNDLICRRVK